MNQRIAVFTHGDIDGMVSAILAMLSLPNAEPRVTYTNAETLHWMLRRLGETDPVPDDVFITDIPLAAAHRTGVATAVKALSEKGSAVHIYDHHLGWDDCPGIVEACTTYSVDTTRSTAAKLVHAGCCQGVAGSGQWLRLISERDRSSDPWIRERFGLLAALTQPRHYDGGEALVWLARGDELSEEQRALSEWYYETHAQRIEDLAARAHVITAASGRRIGWLDLRGASDRPFTAPRVIQRLGVELVVTVTDVTVTVGAGSIDSGPDLTCLHGEHRVNGVSLCVVGHESPVRIDPAGSDAVSDDFVEAVRAFLVERL